ncbi:hypothetical protein SASPL_145255 [Salvia splendens]|uniref:CBS domain-containing protein n=1 Tax=Salvia splendens TaxID=180675 RepID=A0A8X8WIQ6_SALSN|nr:hypothetical protein SASPL_145255 [Salvia splendens]
MSSISRLKVFPLFLLPPTSSVPPFPSRFLLRPSPKPHIPPVFAVASTFNSNSVPPRNGVYRVGDFMTRKEDLHVVKSTTTVEQALQMLVENRITGFPVIDDDWKLVGLVSDYDLLALDSVSGTERSQRTDVGMFPEVDSTWKEVRSEHLIFTQSNVMAFLPHVDSWGSKALSAEKIYLNILGIFHTNLSCHSKPDAARVVIETFKEVQNLLTKTNGQVVGDLMTPAPVVVGFSTSLEDAARVLLKTKYRRLPVVDNDGRLLGIITRGNVVRAALQLKRATEKATTTA